MLLLLLLLCGLILHPLGVAMHAHMHKQQTDTPNRSITPF